MGEAQKPVSVKGLATILVLLYVCVVGGPVVLSILFGRSAHYTFLHRAGGYLALAGFAILVFQVVLAARMKLLDHVFGLDEIYVFHKTMGMLAATMLVLHPLLVASGSGSWDLVLRFNQPWYVQLGKITLVLLIVSVVVSLLFHEFGLRYEQWRRLHNVLAVGIVVGAFVHSMNVGTDVQSWPMRVIWVVFWGVAAIAYIGHKFVGPYRRRKYPFEVVGVEQETHNVWTVKLAPRAGTPPFNYLPGQFQFITLYRGRGLPVEEHPFTISSSPAAHGHHSSTIKASGDFTSSIGQTRAGDLAAVQSPYGRFSYVLRPDENDLVFIAGGIGITPLMSMLRHMSDVQAGVHVLLLYANHTEKDIVFRAELDRIASGPAPLLKVVHILSRSDPSWQGDRGYVDGAVIRRVVGESLGGKVFYICGPPPMMAGVIGALVRQGVHPRNIRTEQFNL